LGKVLTINDGQKEASYVAKYFGSWFTRQWLLLFAIPQNENSFNLSLFLPSSR